MNNDQHIHLSKKLDSLLHTAIHHNLSLGEMVDSIGQKGFGILLFFLALPSALPIPAAGYSTPFGIIITCLALQMIKGKPTPWIPNKTRQMKIGSKLGIHMLKTASWLIKKMEPFIRPRLPFVCGRSGSTIMGILILIMGALMTLPIPLTNTLPAMTIFFIAIGLIEHDGLLCLLATTLASIAAALYAYIIYLIIAYGPDAAIALKNSILAIIKSWFFAVF